MWPSSKRRAGGPHGAAGNNGGTSRQLLVLYMACSVFDLVHAHGRPVRWDPMNSCESDVW